MKGHKVIAIVGMPGAGKGLVSEPARSRGVPVLICGDVIREETERRGLPLTPENMGSVMLAIRREEGPAVVAERLIPKIASSASPIVVIEGVRSMDELSTLRRGHSVSVVAVHASPRTRYERLISRGRSDDPKNWEDFAERDLRELSVGIGNVIALSEEMLVNEGSVDELKAASELVVSKATRK
jgi:dephospho-CoA kinase